MPTHQGVTVMVIPLHPAVPMCREQVLPETDVPQSQPKPLLLP
jgi:hypothetical protein